jgi:hypothetical protein
VIGEFAIQILSTNTTLFYSLYINACIRILLFLPFYLFYLQPLKLPSFNFNHLNCRRAVSSFHRKMASPSLIIFSSLHFLCLFVLSILLQTAKLSSPSPYIDASRCSIIFFYLLIYITINNQCIVQTINIVALPLHSLMLPPSVAGVRQLPTRGLCRLANRSYQLLVTSLRHVDVFGLSIRSHSDSYSRQDMLSHDR